MSGTREQLLKMRCCMAREEVGQSAANDAALSTEQATADVYTPNNISRAANNPPIPHDEGSWRTAGWHRNYKICRVDPPTHVEGDVDVKTHM